MKTSIKNIFAISLSLLISIFIFSNSVNAQETSPTDTQQKTVLDVVKSNENTSDFGEILEKSRYGPVLKKQGPYTILAPTNKALEGVDAKVKENPKKLLKGHLFQGNLSAKQINSQMDVTIKKTDKSASNGVVHFVDTVVQN